MRTATAKVLVRCSLAAALAAGGCATLVAQAERPAATAPRPDKSAARPADKTWTPHKTPWGDPDISGTFTSDNYIGVPFERPQQFAGRTELTEEEFAARERANAEQIAKD